MKLKRNLFAILSICCPLIVFPSWMVVNGFIKPLLGDDADSIFLHAILVTAGAALLTIAGVILSLVAWLKKENLLLSAVGLLMNTAPYLYYVLSINS